MTTKTRAFLASTTGGFAALASMATFAVAAGVPSITAVAQNSSNTIITSALTGTSVHAVAKVASSTASTSPTGTVDFNVYANTSCTGAVLTQTGVALVNGHATSSNTALTATGLSYKVHYNGQGDLYTAGDSLCMPVATTTSPTSTGTISGTVFNDLNRDGDQDSGEPGLSGWKVWLHQKATTTPRWWKRDNKRHLYNTPIIQTATTDGSGNYAFNNLVPGIYFVEQEEKRGWKQKSDDRRVVLSDTNTSADVDFANVEKKRKHDNDDNDHDRDDWTKEQWQKWWNDRFEKFWERKNR